MNNDQIIKDKAKEAQRQRQERQKESVNYIETNKLDNLLTEMMISVLNSNTDKPIVHMVYFKLKR
jgi:hypothetical protein